MRCRWRVRQVIADAAGALDYANYEFFPQYERKIDGTTVTNTKHYFFGGQRIAQKVGTGVLTYLHADHLGSTMETTGVVGDKRFQAYGATRSTSGTYQTDFGYTGQHNDASGLLYYKARYYEPASGQFVSPDTIVPDPNNLFDYNRYMYGYGNPVKNSDPSGHCATNGDGSENREGEENYNCWMLVDALYALYQTGLTSFKFSNGFTIDAWRALMGSSPGFDVAYLQPQFDKYNAQWEAAVGINQAYTPNPIPEGYGEPIHPCEIWDCVALGLQSASLGTSILQTGAAMCTTVTGPLCGEAALYLTAADVGLSGVSTAYSAYQYLDGSGSLTGVTISTAELTVSLADAAVPAARLSAGTVASAVPVAGVAYDTVMIGLLLIQPLLPPAP